MRRPSRFIPKEEASLPAFVRWVGIGVVLCGFLWLLTRVALFLVYAPLTVALLVVGFAVFLMLESGRQKDPRPEAGPDDICIFAREFDCRTVDPWVIRATHEEFRSHSRKPGQSAAVRADDTLGWMDEEDIEEIAMIVAHRTGRDLNRPPLDYINAKLHTVREFVETLNAFPIDKAQRLDG